MIFPARAEALAQAKTEVRHRSWFKVPVYHSELKFNASFDLTGAPAADPRGALADVFYLLLLSIAERIGFDLAFLIAATATVSLISIYAGWVFESRSQGIRAWCVFSLVYLLIYFLMRLEDQALLIGAIASFAAVAAIMYFTRHIDWYSSGMGPLSAASEPERTP